MILTSGQIIQNYQKKKLSPDLREYLTDHAKRFEFLLGKVDQIIKDRKAQKILDVGISFETEILRQNYPDIEVDSLGFFDKRFRIRPSDKHIEYNLNETPDKKSWPKTKSYDLIIMAEVIEHLPTSPVWVLQYISSLLKPGGLLIIQTPNAVSLKRRLKMLSGQNPSEMIRENLANPGHFREYTSAELITVSRGCRLKLIESSAYNYYRHKGRFGKLYDIVCRLFPASFQDGLYLCFSKE